MVAGRSVGETTDISKDKLEGLINLEIRTDYVRPKIKSNKGAHYGFTLEKEIRDGLKDYGINIMSPYLCYCWLHLKCC